MGNDKVKPSQFSSPEEYLRNLNAQLDSKKASELGTKYQTGEIIGSGVTPTSSETPMVLTPKEKAKIIDEGMTISDYKNKYFDKGYTFEHFKYDQETTILTPSEEYLRAISSGVVGVLKVINQGLDIGAKYIGLEEDPTKATGLDKEDPAYGYKLFDKYLQEFAWKNGVKVGAPIPKNIEDAAAKTFNRAMTGYLTAGADDLQKKIQEGTFLGMDPNMQVNPYNPEGKLSNPLWWRQGISSVLSSATEFGITAYLTGGLGVATEKLALNVAETLGAMKTVDSAIKASKLAEGLNTGVRALASNLTEGFDQGLANRRDRYNELIAKGVNPGLAEEQAKSEMDQFIGENLVWTATDFATLASIGNAGKRAMEGGLKKSWLDTGKELAKEAPKEAFEEYGQDWRSYDIAKAGNLKLGIKNDAWGILDYTLTQGIESAFWGAVGGPLQHLAGKGTTTLWNRTVGKKIASKNQVEPFTKEAPSEPEVPKHEMENQDPGTYSEFLSNKYGHTRISKEEVLKHETENTEIKKGDRKEYEARKKAFETEYNANKDSVDSWDLYEAEKQNYDREKAEHAKKLWEHANAKKLSKIGTKEQTALDLQEAIDQDKTLEEDFVNASRANDAMLMEDIENRRFENLFFRYASRGAIRGGKAGLYETLSEMSTDQNATQEQRTVANKFLEKLPDLEKTFIDMYANPKTAPFIQHAFKVKARIDSLGNTLTQANTKVTEAINDLITDVKNTTDENVNPLVVESMILRKEAAALKVMEENLKKNKTITDEVAKAISERKAALVAKSEKLEEELKQTPVEELASKTIINNSEKMNSLQQAISKRSDIAISYEALKLQKIAIDSGKLYDDVKNGTYTFISKAIESAETDEDIDVVNDAILTSPLSKKDKLTLSKALIEKMNSNEFLKKKTIEEYKQAEEINKSFKNKLETLNSQKDKLEKSLRNSNRLLALSKALDKVQKYKNEIEQFDKKLKNIQDELGYVNNVLFETKRRIAELKATNEIKDYELLLRQYLDDINNTTSTQKEFVAQELGTSPEATEAFENLMESAEHQKNIEPTTIPEVIHSIGIKDGELSTDFAIVDEDQLHRESKLTTITYISPTDSNKDYTSINTNIADWLENENYSKEGMSVQISCTQEDLEYYEKAAKTNKYLQKYVTTLRNYLSGKKLNSVEIAMLPIRMTVLNSTGQPILYKDNKVFGYLHDSGYYKNIEEQSDKMTEMRNHIVYNLNNNIPLKGKIDYSGKGNYKFDEQIEAKYPLSIIGYTPTLMVASHEGILYTRKKGKGQSTTYTEATGNIYVVDKKYAGIMYMNLYAANGQGVPVRLNSRKLNTNEVEALSIATVDLLTSTVKNKITMNSTISDNIKALGFENLTYKNLFDLAIFEGKDSNYFYLNFKEKKLKLGPDIYSFYDLAKTPDKGKKIISDYLSTLWRSVRSDILNQPMSEFKGDTFKWNNIEVTPEMNYTELITKDNVLTTNIVAYSKGKQIKEPTTERPTIFVRPVITLDDYSNWGGKAVSKDNSVANNNVKVEKDLKAQAATTEIVDGKEVKVVGKNALIEAIAKNKQAKEVDVNEETQIVKRERRLMVEKLQGRELSKEAEVEFSNIKNKKLLNLYELLDRIKNDKPLNELEGLLDKELMEDIMTKVSLVEGYDSIMQDTELKDINDLELIKEEKTLESVDIETVVEKEVASNISFEKVPETSDYSAESLLALFGEEKTETSKPESKKSSTFTPVSLSEIASKENEELSKGCKNE